MLILARVLFGWSRVLCCTVASLCGVLALTLKACVLGLTGTALACQVGPVSPACTRCVNIVHPLPPPPPALPSLWLWPWCCFLCVLAFHFISFHAASHQVRNTAYFPKSAIWAREQCLLLLWRGLVPFPWFSWHLAFSCLTAAAESPASVAAFMLQFTYGYGFICCSFRKNRNGFLSGSFLGCPRSAFTFYFGGKMRDPSEATRHRVWKSSSQCSLITSVMKSNFIVWRKRSPLVIMAARDRCQSVAHF